MEFFFFFLKNIRIFYKFRPFNLDVFFYRLLDQVKSVHLNALTQVSTFSKKNHSTALISLNFFLRSVIQKAIDFMRLSI